MTSLRKLTSHIVVHCSATRPSMDIGAKEIDRWHRSRGWLGIGYHYVIRRDGTIEDGRPIGAVGAHTRGYNGKSVGVCLVGGVTEDDHTVAENNFTGAQIASLYDTLAELKETYPTAEIIGHNEVAAKACPSFNVQSWLQSYPDLLPSPEEDTEEVDCPHPNCPLRKQ